MRYHWVRERVQSGEFDVTWLAGSKNIADFFTKPLPAPNHKELQALLMAPSPSLSSSVAPTAAGYRRSNNVFDVLGMDEDDDASSVASDSSIRSLSTA